MNSGVNFRLKFGWRPFEYNAALPFAQLEF
jgi:hypothetical protein